MFERYSHRARCLIFIALWSARRRGGLYIEPEDLLHALIREDRGESTTITADIYPAGDHRPFFSDGVARTLLRELHENPDSLSRETPGETRELVPPVDVPVPRSLKEVLALVAKAHLNDTKTIEPLDLLAGIVGNRDSRLAHLLEDCGITRQSVAKAIDSESLDD